MSFTFCTSGAIQAKAGLNVNSTIVSSGAYLEQLSNDAENTINVATRKDWTAIHATLSANVQSILADAASNLAGSYLIVYDMSGYTSRGEAESMINVLRDAYMRDIQLLKDIKKQTFIENA